MDINDVAIALQNLDQLIGRLVTNTEGLPAFAPGVFTYSAPISGATVTMAQGDQRVIIDPAGAIAALTVTLPSAPQDGNTVEMMTSQAITALTVNAPGGASVNGGAFMLTANGGASWLYRSVNTTWYRRY